jgi:hypothetical protein
MVCRHDLHSPTPTATSRIFHGNFIPKRYSSFDLTSQWMA